MASTFYSLIVLFTYSIPESYDVYADKTHALQVGLEDTVLDVKNQIAALQGMFPLSAFKPSSDQASVFACRYPAL